MGINKFSFYAKHYDDIQHLLKLDKDVRTEYSEMVWGRLQEAFADWLDGKFAGVDGWKCDGEDETPKEWYSFWNINDHDDEKNGPYFEVDFEDATEPFTNKQDVDSSACCYLHFEGKRSPTSITSKSLIAAVKRETPKLKAKHFRENDWDPDFKGCYVQIDIGDLLHISTLNDWKTNSDKLKTRVEKLVRACIPVIRKAAKA